MKPGAEGSESKALIEENRAPDHRFAVCCRTQKGRRVPIPKQSPLRRAGVATHFLQNDCGIRAEKPKSNKPTPGKRTHAASLFSGRFSASRLCRRPAYAAPGLKGFLFQDAAKRSRKARKRAMRFKLVLFPQPTLRQLLPPHSDPSLNNPELQLS